MGIFILHCGGSAVIKYDNEGNQICSYGLPEKFITNVCFAGKNLDRMFVTTAKTDDKSLKSSIIKGGHVYEVFASNIKGVPTNKFLILNEK